MISVLSNYENWGHIAAILWNAEMGYNTTLFWLYMMGFIGVYLILWNSSIRKYWILLGSIVFYIWSGLGAFIIVLGTAISVYVATRYIEKIYQEFDLEKEGLTAKEKRALFTKYRKRAQKYMWLAFCLLVCIWVGVKIGKLLDFDTVESLFEVSMGLGIIVPLGISYYTLSSVGYLLDVYWRKTKPEHNFIDLFSAMIYFPHIVQGPISKYSGLITQMKELPKVDYKRVCFGLQLMLWGYIKKLIIADRASVYTTIIFVDPASYSGGEIAIAVVLCVIQLYADFSGCMDIVIGISQVLGIQLEQNFRQPFFAKDAQEFWSRWHMTLGNWTKDYIYIPLAVDPKVMKRIRKLQVDGHIWWASFFRAFIPLVCVWIFTGLWHGTGWDYLLWGLYWCVLMTLSKELKPFTDKIGGIIVSKTNQTIIKLSHMLKIYMIFAIGRMITVTGTITGGAYLLKRIVLDFNFQMVSDGTIFTYGLDRKDTYVMLIGILLMLIVDIVHERGKEIRENIAKQRFFIRWGVYYLAFMAVVIFGMYGPGLDAASFVYGAF